ncbi:MAG TPA: thiamine phosphate synthase [Planctomycetota bacterium]|nr:thiamine phosphate synthase [Planctomycetota bacterium]
MHARLYLVLTPQACRRDPVATAVAAIEGGADMVQLRDKQATDDAFLDLARALADVCRPRGIPLVLNDRVHLVEAAGADGVHVGEDDAPPEAIDPRLLIGLSTHDRAGAKAARGRGAKYVGIGPMFPTATKDLTRAPGGTTLLRDVLTATDLPVFPIGGITAENAPQLIAAGATRLAVSSAICGANDPCAAAARLRRLLG